MPRSRVVVCLHPRDCDCPSCLREWSSHMEAVRDLDELAARDPEPHAREEFAAWVSQQPEEVANG